MASGLVSRTMIGIPYEQIDLILLAKENDLYPEKISSVTGIELKEVNDIPDLIVSSSSTRELYPSGF